MNELLEKLHQQQRSYERERDKYAIEKRDNPRLYDWFNAKAEATNQNMKIVLMYMKEDGE